ncbi:MAG TPA: DUF692 family protein [Terriglobales bacterium]|nr:DUF692 family protein [Terriglobales bacterium]
MNLPELGVGLTWFTGLEPVAEANAALIDLLEIEPQALWRRDPSGNALVIDQSALAAVRQRAAPKLLHSVGLPVGGTHPPQPSDLDVLRRVAVELEAPWLSEHLSFNRVGEDSHAWHTGFLLPPRQTLAGVDAAVSSVRALSCRMPVPVAIEGGVSYLQPRADELPDGEFVARVAEAADCGILLDLQNVWTNQHHGRQTVGEYIDQLPLERVWEIHLAAGSNHRSYCLDADPGPAPADLVELASRIVPRLPNLKALVFELFPSNLPRLGVALLRSQLEALHRLWDRRASGTDSRPQRRGQIHDPDPGPSPLEWESTLAALTAHKECSNPLAQELRADPGLSIIRGMVDRFRGSMVVRTLRLSSRLIILERGTGYLEQLLAAFWKVHPAKPCALDEAEAFATFLQERKPYVPFLSEVLEYDRAVIAVALHGEERLVPFRADPLPLLGALGAGRRPTEIATGNFEVRLTPDRVVVEAQALSQMHMIH